MFIKRHLIIGFGVAGLIGVFVGGYFLWQRSEQQTLQYQSPKHFEAAQEDGGMKEAPQDSSVTGPEENQKPENAEIKTSEGTKETVTEEKQKEETSADQKPKSFAIKSKLVSFGHESASGRKINTVVLHSSYSVSGDPYDVDAVIALWKSYGVAPHYMIARDGTVYQLVSDKDIAYHAGDSKMPDGRTGVNNFSIGVEILNTKTDNYTSAQYQAVKDLMSYLKNKYGKMEVVGHDTIAPGRKTDPWNFNWSKI